MGRDRWCEGREPYHSPAPGTVVDTVVTSSVLSDFFLVPVLLHLARVLVRLVSLW